MCKYVLYYCYRVSPQLHLINISIYQIPLVEPASFSSRCPFSPPWNPHSAPEPFFILSLMMYSYDTHFITKFLHCFCLIIYKSGYATEIFAKVLSGGGLGVLNFKCVLLHSPAIRLESKCWDIWKKAHAETALFVRFTRYNASALPFPTAVRRNRLTEQTANYIY